MNENVTGTPADNPVDVTTVDSKAIHTPDQAKRIVHDELLAGLNITSSVNKGLEPTDEINYRFAQIQIAANPLLEAAQPLLLALAQLPLQDFKGADEISVFRKLLEHEIITFTNLCNRANIRREHVVAASYALCTGLDEFANHTHWGRDKDGGVGAWSTQMLASQFHHDIEGGEKVFLLIGRLMNNPAQHLDLLHVMFRILAMGVEGQYSNRPHGRRDVEAIRMHIYAELCKFRSPVPLALSPNWKGEPAGKFRSLYSIPVWVTASVLALAAFGVFSWYKYQLVKQSNVLEDQINAIGKMTPPPVPIVPALRLAELLKDEIASGKVTVEEKATHSAVTFKGDDMFVPAQSRMSPAILPLLNKVADQIAKVSGAVHVIGHTDNIPINTLRFPNNQVLSEERAGHVADALQARGIAASRLTVSGKGDAEPVTGNATPAQRARNRRVDIVVRQSDGQGEKTTLGAPSPVSLPARAAR